MANEQQEFSLRLELEHHELPLTFVINTTKDLRRLLRLIEESRSGQEAQAKWSLDTDHFQITASVNGVSGNELQGIVSDTYDGFRVGDQQGNDWPPSLATEAQDIVRRVVTRVKQTAAARLDVEGYGTLYIDPETQVAKALPSEEYGAWSSIDGTLDVISVRRVPYFVIFEHVTEYRVRCRFPDEWLDNVKALLGSRVVAEGYIKYRSDGIPSILTDARSLIEVPEPEQADITVYRGTMPGMSDELSSYEYVRQMRVAEDD